MKQYSERLLGICHDIIHDVDEHLSPNEAREAV